MGAWRTAVRAAWAADTRVCHLRGDLGRARRPLQPCTPPSDPPLAVAAAAAAADIACAAERQRAVRAEAALRAGGIRQRVDLLAVAEAAAADAWARVRAAVRPGEIHDTGDPEPRRYRRRVDAAWTARAAVQAAAAGGVKIRFAVGGSVPNCYDYPAWSQAAIAVAWPDGTALLAQGWIAANKRTEGGAVAALVGEAARPWLDGRWPAGHPRRIEAEAEILRWAGRLLGRDTAAEEEPIRERAARVRATQRIARLSPAREARWTKTVSRLAHDWAAGIPVYRFTRPDRERWERACSEERTRRRVEAEAEEAARRGAPTPQDISILWGGGRVAAAGRDMGGRAAALEMD